MEQFSLIHQMIAAKEGNAPHPCLVLLHGLGDSEAGLMALAAQFDPRVYVISARAPLRHRWGGFSWYELETEGPGLGGKSIERSISLLQDFLDEIVRAYSVDPSRLYIGGFSMGAAMAGATALLFPDRIAGAIMVSGFLPPDVGGRYRAREAAGHPFFQAHGTMDPVISITYAHMTRATLRAMPIDLTYREYPTGHTVTPEEILDLGVWFANVLDKTPTPPVGPR